MVSVEAGLRTSGVGIAANVILASGKITAGILGNSNALIADGIESTADVIGSLVVLGGLWYSARPADEDHPYGHGKAESAAGLLVALAVLAAAALIAWQSIHEILIPHQTPSRFTLAVLAVVIVVKEALYRWVGGVGEELGSTAVRADAWHHRLDALTSFAAGIGITIALVGGKGWESADDWAALLACGMIAYNGLRLLRQPVNELMDASADAACVARIRDTARAVPGVSGIGRCRVRKSGLGLIVDLHLKLPPDMSVRDSHRLAHDVEAALRGLPHGVIDVSIHVEPAAEPARAGSPAS